MSTKRCPGCGTPYLVELVSLDYKVCVDCQFCILWPLDPGQKPLFESTEKRIETGTPSVPAASNGSS